MNWRAAMRWARARAQDTGERYAVRGYRRPDGSGWAYVAGRAARLVRPTPREEVREHA